MLLIDLETQSFPVESGIYEVACLAVEDYEIVDKLYLGKAIKGYEGSRKYGYGFHDISSNDKVIGNFRKFVNNYYYPLVAHNCPFDKKFLLYYGWVEKDYVFYCSMRAIKMEVDNLDSYSMSNLLKHFEIAEETEHDAMSDILNLYKLLKLIKPKKWLPVGSSVSRKKKWPRYIKPRTLENIDLPVPTTKILLGENVCFTGKSQYQRHTMQELAIKNGADISNNITSKTTLLVVGLKAGSKLNKAQEKEISIISDEEFMRMINLANISIEEKQDVSS